MKQFKDGLSTKKHFARQKLNVKFWQGGRDFVDDIMKMIELANIQFAIKVTSSDILNFLLIREMKNNSNIREYAEKIAFLSLKNLEIETKYLKKQPIGKAQITTTFAEPIIFRINDLVEAVSAVRENAGNTKAVRATSIVQLMLINCLADVGEEVDSEDGLAKFIFEIFRSYNYNSLIE